MSLKGNVSLNDFFELSNVHAVVINLPSSLHVHLIEMGDNLTSAESIPVQFVCLNYSYNSFLSNHSTEEMTCIYNERSCIRHMAANKVHLIKINPIWYLYDYLTWYSHFSSRFNSQILPADPKMVFSQSSWSRELICKTEVSLSLLVVWPLNFLFEIMAYQATKWKK